MDERGARGGRGLSCERGPRDERGRGEGREKMRPRARLNIFAMVSLQCTLTVDPNTPPLI